MILYFEEISLYYAWKIVKSFWKLLVIFCLICDFLWFILLWWVSVVYINGGVGLLFSQNV